jgi:pimeloyl-ACP methyl ester carboxylesterase
MIAESDGGQVADLPEIVTPVLLLVGTEEPFAGHALEAAELLPSGACVALQGLDHVQTFFRSDLVLPHVREFLARPKI